MKLPKFFTKKNLLLVLLSTFIGFTALSWWLLFRDEKALNGYEMVYPFLGGRLLNWRQVLSKFYLNFLPTILFAFLGVTSFGAYFLLLKESFSIKKVVKIAIIFQVIVFFSYPILSTDIFSYIFSDRVNTEYGYNKWLIAPFNFPEDKFEKFADWKDQVNVYGYINHLVYLPANYLGFDDVLITVIFYKLTVFVFVIASLFAFLKLFESRNVSNSEVSYYLRVIFWNPLLLLEILGSGHNDIILIFFILLSLLFWRRKKMLLAGLFLAFSFQIKLTSIVLFGFFAFKLLTNQKIIDLFKYVFSFLVVNLLAFKLMGVTFSNFMQRISYNTESYWQSLPGLFSKFLPQVSIPFTIIFVLVGLILLIFQFKNNLDPIFTSTLAIFIFIIFITGSYWNWYVLWIFMLMPFIKNKIIQKTILILTFTSLMAYPLLWFSCRFGSGNSLWYLVNYLWIFAVPLLFLGYNHLKLNKG